MGTGSKYNAMTVFFFFTKERFVKKKQFNLFCIDSFILFTIPVPRVFPSLIKDKKRDLRFQ